MSSSTAGYGAGAGGEPTPGQVPLVTAISVQAVLKRAGFRRPIAMLDDAPIRSELNLDLVLVRRGFLDIISKVNTTYDIDKIVPTAATPLLLALPNSAMSASKASSLHSASKTSLLQPPDASGAQQQQQGQHDTTITMPADLSPPPARPAGFLRRMSVGAVDLLKQLSGRGEHINPAVHALASGDKLGGNASSSGSLNMASRNRRSFSRDNRNLSGDGNALAEVNENDETEETEDSVGRVNTFGRGHDEEAATATTQVAPIVFTPLAASDDYRGSSADILKEEEEEEDEEGKESEEKGGDEEDEKVEERERDDVFLPKEEDDTTGSSSDWRLHAEHNNRRLSLSQQRRASFAGSPNMRPSAPFTNERRSSNSMLVVADSVGGHAGAVSHFLPPIHSNSRHFLTSPTGKPQPPAVQPPPLSIVTTTPTITETGPSEAERRMSLTVPGVAVFPSGSPITSGPTAPTAPPDEPTNCPIQPAKSVTLSLSAPNSDSRRPSHASPGLSSIVSLGIPKSPSTANLSNANLVRSPPAGATLGGHVLTPVTDSDFGGFQPSLSPFSKRRTSGSSFMLSVGNSMAIPKSPSRSDLLKGQGIPHVAPDGTFMVDPEPPLRSPRAQHGLVFAIPPSGHVFPSTPVPGSPQFKTDRLVDIDSRSSEVEMAGRRSSVDGGGGRGPPARRPSTAPGSPGGLFAAMDMHIPTTPAGRSGSTASKYVELLARLRSSKTPPPGAQTGDIKIKSFGRVVQIASDLKKVGEDASLATELDPAALQMVIGLKKWARKMQQKKLARTKVQKAVEDLELRSANELPRAIHLDLIRDAIPLVQAAVESYKRQLGDKHSFAAGCSAHLERLNKMILEQEITLADMPTEEEERNAANAMALHLLKSRAKSSENIGSHPSIGQDHHLGPDHRNVSGSLNIPKRGSTLKEKMKYTHSKRGIKVVAPVVDIVPPPDENGKEASTIGREKSEKRIEQGP
ncbi:hypothetical protein HK101_002381 [Irineochytrium annulatum]|nr:hypothetical protein HK101_002381 [Irineochytrium annulatum]